KTRRRLAASEEGGVEGRRVFARHLHHRASRQTSEAHRAARNGEAGAGFEIPGCGRRWLADGSVQLEEPARNGRSPASRNKPLDLRGRLSAWNITALPHASTSSA